MKKYIFVSILTYFILIIFLVVGIGMTYLGITRILDNPEDDILIEISGTVASCGYDVDLKEEDDWYILTLKEYEGVAYYLREYPDLNTEIIDHLAENKELVTIKVWKDEIEAGINSAEIYELRAGDKCLLSLEEHYEWCRKNNYFSTGFGLFSILASAAMIVYFIINRKREKWFYLNEKKWGD